MEETQLKKEEFKTEMNIVTQLLEMMGANQRLSFNKVNTTEI
jgi:hypothetical protein